MPRSELSSRFLVAWSYETEPEGRVRVVRLGQSGCRCFAHRRRIRNDVIRIPLALCGIQSAVKLIERFSRRNLRGRIAGESCNCLRLDVITEYASDATHDAGSSPCVEPIEEDVFIAHFQTSVVKLLSADAHAFSKLIEIRLLRIQRIGAGFLRFDYGVDHGSGIIKQ